MDCSLNRIMGIAPTSLYRPQLVETLEKQLPHREILLRDFLTSAQRIISTKFRFCSITFKTKA